MAVVGGIKIVGDGLTVLPEILLALLTLEARLLKVIVNPERTFPDFLE